jgi:hypothetical protein
MNEDRVIGTARNLGGKMQDRFEQADLRGADRPP